MHTFDRDIEDRVWRLRYISQWNYRRIAQAVGVSLGSVHNILKRRALALGHSQHLSAARKPRAIALDDAHDFEWNEFIAGPAAAPREHIALPAAESDPVDVESVDAGDDESDSDELQTPFWK